MGTKEKLIKRFLSQPSDFTWNEYCRLFNILGFSLSNKGKTSGSRILFVKDNIRYFAHKPHPEKFIDKGMMKQTLEFLTKNDLL